MQALANPQAAFKAAYSPARKAMKGQKVYGVSRVFVDGRIYMDLHSTANLLVPCPAIMWDALLQVMGMKYASPLMTVPERLTERRAGWDQEDDEFVYD